MSAFTPAEITYLQSQRLARVATSGPGGQPHVVAVSFRYNPDEDTIDVGGHGFAQRKKYRNVERNPRLAIVIDDLATVDPWRPRMIEIRGQADIVVDHNAFPGVPTGLEGRCVTLRMFRAAFDLNTTIDLLLSDATTSWVIGQHCSSTRVTSWVSLRPANRRHSPESTSAAIATAR